MRRASIALLVMCAVLAVGSAAGSLARAASESAGERFDALAPHATWTPSSFIYLPLVMRNAAPASWVTVVEEGFEAPPGSLWKFYDKNQPMQGAYYWGRRNCNRQEGKILDELVMSLRRATSTAHELLSQAFALLNQ